MRNIEIKYAEISERYISSLWTITIAGGSAYEQPIWRNKADKIRTEGRDKGWSFTVEGLPFSFDDPDAVKRLQGLPSIPESHKGDDAYETPECLIGDTPRGR